MTVPDEKILFVICPIGADESPERMASDDLMEYIIDPIATSFRCKVVRADKIMKSGSITSQIFELLASADIVVADMTGHNANVFYELAVRHAVGGPVIHMTTDNGEGIPFDVADQRAIYYTLDLPGAKAARTALAAMMREIESGEPEPSSPIALSIQRRLLSESPAPSDRRDSEILSILSDIRVRLFDLEHAKRNGARAVTPETIADLASFLSGIDMLAVQDTTRVSAAAVAKAFLDLVLKIEEDEGFDTALLHSLRHPSVLGNLVKVYKEIDSGLTPS